MGISKALTQLPALLRKQVPAGVTPSQPGTWGDWGNSWWGLIREPFAGAWQRNLEMRAGSVLTYHAVYSCVTLIASDVAKCNLDLVELKDQVWEVTENPAFSPVLRQPNHYQNRIQFYENWVVSKLLSGNTYVLKVRDNRKVVVALHVLNPTRVKPLVAPNGEVYYEMTRDNLADLVPVEDDGKLRVPASEIIHDVMIPLYHPLCGVSPLTACYIAALQGLAIQSNSARFFENGSRPGGILSAPGTINDTTAGRLKDYWEKNFTGENSGKVAVLGDGLTYEALSVNAVESELIDQLKLTAETVCSAFHVPPFKIGIGQMPTYNNVEALNIGYYSDCLQKLFESIELGLDIGLGLAEKTNPRMGVAFDLDDLLKMDSSSRVKTSAEAIKGGISTPNEERRRFNLPPVKGGNSVYLQQQNFSLEALAKRDAKEDPFASGKAPAPAATPGDEGEEPEEDADNDNELQAAYALIEVQRGLANGL